MMDLKMEVYTPSLELIGFLEIQRSVIWSDKAFSSGSFSVESIITPETLAMLQPENIIWIEGETAGIIEYVQENADETGPYITVKGCTLTGILNRRVLWGLYNLSGTVPEIMHALVDDCCVNPTRGDVDARKIPGLVLLDTPAGGETIQLQKTGGYLLDVLQSLGETYGVSFGVRFNPAVPQMEFWTRWGENRTIYQDANNPVLYSTELDDVLSSEYLYNAQDYRNVALVGGEGEGSERVYVTVERDEEPKPGPVPPTPPGPEPVVQYTVTLLVDPAGGGTASGGKTVAAGVQITVTAAPFDGYEFTEWQENGVTVSTNKMYTFTVTADRTLTATFAEAKPSSRLPDGYTEVEYIQSSGAQYIDTGIKPTSAFRLELDIEPTVAASSTTRYFFDSHYFPATTGNRYAFRVAWGTSGITAAMGGYVSVTSTVLSSSTARRRVTIIMDMPSLTGSVDLETQGFKNNSVSTLMNNITLLTYSDGGSTSGRLSANLYSCKMFDGGAPVRDFVPCINPSGEIGLYDLVGGTFYGNAGTGTAFTAGPGV